MLEELVQRIEADMGSRGAGDSIDSEIARYCKDTLLPALEKKEEKTWQKLSGFWPPRCIKAAKDNKLIIFFGAGLSIPCGIPGWQDLLKDRFGIDNEYLEDKELQNDPLTMAELASHMIGSEKLQDILRKTVREVGRFSVSHLLLAALRCRYYLTTNYDDLFERAWEYLHPERKIHVVSTDSDLADNQLESIFEEGGTVLFKIHGCVCRSSEHLILSRSDYRRHYRTNDVMIGEISNLLVSNHTLFLGFSHRDPEITRLVDGSIHDFEKTMIVEELLPHQVEGRPQFYSLQFDMRSHTPEVFAAKGIVALKPPVPTAVGEDYKSLALATGLANLVASIEGEFHQELFMDDKLADAIELISADIKFAIEKLESNISNALGLIEHRNSDNAWMTDLLHKLQTKNLASQGVYLVDRNGVEVARAIPEGLNSENRKLVKPIQTRPYFRQATSLRKPFLSDSTKSIFNDQSTVFFCKPVLNDREQLIGLLFVACQIGQWRTPIDIGKKLWCENLDFILIDSNGVCLLPPKGEIEVSASEKIIEGEGEQANQGYSYHELLERSRRDSLIKHLAHGIVPITQDDDVCDLSSELTHYSIMSEIPDTRWKVGISRSITRIN